MDDHFLLKLPQNLATKVHHDISSNNYTNIEIYIRGDNTYFKYRDDEYLSLFYDLPCIIEAHKTMDTRQFFKVNDVSSCLYVIDNEEDKIGSESLSDADEEMDYYDLNREINEKCKKIDNLDKKSKEYLTRLVMKEQDIIDKNKAFCYSREDLNDLRQKLELSGITPPLKLAKINTFRKKSAKVKKNEEREQKIKDLLEKDRHSDKVEIEFVDPDEYEEDLETSDVSSFAAEIEYNLTMEQREDMSEDIRAKRGLLGDIEDKIKKKEEQLMMATNLIVQKRFSESLAGLQAEREKILKEIEMLESDGGNKI